MKLRILGPLGRVTGSGYLLEHEGRLILVDYGVRQGEGASGIAWNTARPDFDVARLDYVFLTHAHLDHCGNLPLLVRHGWRGKVLCTRETAALARIVLEDAVRHDGCAWDGSDLAKLEFAERGPQVLDRLQPIAQDLWFCLHRTGHIAGATSVQLIWGPRDDQRTIAFSGDIGPARDGAEGTLLHGHWMAPRGMAGPNTVGVPPLDTVVMESTYGGRVRDVGLEARLEHLEALIRETNEQRGVLVLPCFAVDRTQAVLLDLHLLAARRPGLFGETTVFLDAPMAERVNRAYVEALTRCQAFRTKVRPMWLGGGFFRALGLDRRDREDLEVAAALLRAALIQHRGYAPAPAPDHSSDLVRHWRPLVAAAAVGPQETGPAVLVTGGGMLSGGRALQHLPRLLRSPATTLALTGYCAPGTLGYRLGALSRVPASDRALFPDGGTYYPELGLQTADIRARITRLSGYSGHADHDELVDYAFPRDRDGRRRVLARRILLTHGDDPARRALKSALEARSTELAAAFPDADFRTSVQLPAEGQGWIDLDDDIEETFADELAALRRRIALLEGRGAA